ncbi:AEC family transporter [Verticiella sediminum]|uniref:AEC family transporter n=1 Tax=Verticiella sediminum TaxID=1247510 RepID=A0A556AY10_9BURK|nr:AEC family transporter [Verticiella sediminum]TSH97345.1 AEC family transporter [Verticiella sediminum]
MSNLVFQALVPVVLLIFTGYLAGRLGWVGGKSTGDISNIVFLVLAPALLFRTMSNVHLESIDFQPVIAYMSAMGVVFVLVMLKQGFNRRAAVMGLASTFSNTLMIGVPIVGLAFGDAGLVTLFSLVSVHSFIMLTLVTVVLEFVVVAEENRARAAHGESAPLAVRARRMALTVCKAAKGAILHPVPLPIICGLLFAQTGLPLPGVVDKALQLLGSAFAPMALVLVGITLASNAWAKQIRSALTLVIMKNLVHPLALVVIGLAAGLSGLPFKVMVVTASLPIGANVYLFALRYRVAESETSAAVALSTIVGLASMALVMLSVPLLPG